MNIFGIWILIFALIFFFIVGLMAYLILNNEGKNQFILNIPNFLRV
jgi:hypothetical protein